MLRWREEEPPDNLAEAAAEVLSSGGLVVAPTETRYGLLARHDSEEAIGRLYDAKGRPPSMPTALFVNSAERIREHALVTAISERLLERFMPGSMTLVLKAITDWRPPRVVDGKIGFRWSPSPLIDAVVSRVPFMVTATSANLSGRPELETVEEIAGQFGNAVSLYIDGGRLQGPVSTVVDCSGDRPAILRIGAIAPELIWESIRDLIAYE